MLYLLLRCLHEDKVEGRIDEQTYKQSVFKAAEIHLKHRIRG